jgi:hypothetical protein
MSSKNRDNWAQDRDKRLEWQRPAFRRLATEYAEGGGPTSNEGNNNPGGTHSAKNA